MEFYGGVRYVYSKDQRAFLNTALIFDDVNYLSNVFQISMQHLAHDAAASLVANEVYRDVLSCRFRMTETDLKVRQVLDVPEDWDFADVTDEDIWRGSKQFPGLYQLSHARCLCFLISDDAETRLSTAPHPDVYAPEILMKRFQIPAPWFFKAAERLRSESKFHFKAMAIRVHYADDENVTDDWIAEALGIETTEELNKILASATNIVEEYIMGSVQTLRGKSEGLVSLLSRYRDFA